MELVHLFGNNMSVQMPAQYKDVSTMREIPDNQEVFSHDHTDQSIIIEILEYVQEEDEQAIRTHFDDLAKSNDSSESNISLVENVPLEKIQMTQCQNAYFVSGQQQVAKFNEMAKNSINLHLGLFRLPGYATDILITFNDPVSVSPQSSSNLPEPEGTRPWTLDHFREILCSLNILDADFLG